jgi:hypothetical protein
VEQVICSEDSEEERVLVCVLAPEP